MAENVNPNTKNVRLLILRGCAVPGQTLQVGRVLRAAPPALAAKLIALGNAVDVSDDAALDAALAKLQADHDTARAAVAAAAAEDEAIDAKVAAAMDKMKAADEAAQK